MRLLIALADDDDDEDDDSGRSPARWLRWISYSFPRQPSLHSTVFASDSRPFVARFAAL